MVKKWKKGMEYDEGSSSQKIMAGPEDLQDRHCTKRA